MRIAQQRETEREALESEPGYLEAVCKEERRVAEELRRDEARSMLENAAWLQRELLDQQEFRRRRELAEKRRTEQEARERLIREEWESLRQKENEENEIKEREKMEKEEKLREALSAGDKPPVSGKEAWRNPLAPEGYKTTPQSHTPSRDYATEKDRQNCSFFLKTGACRFGERCSRQHPRPASSCTLLVPSMYSSLGLQELLLNERDQDVALEHDDRETYEHFCGFYGDVLPEFSKAGKVVQFKVSCNHEAHLRGNVYVQYSTEEECEKAFQLFNGRWYAQKQLSCEFSPVKKWKSAICGLYNHKRCPKGRSCNFLHVFRNPLGAFSRADLDLPPLSPQRPSSSAHRHPSRFDRNHHWDRRGSLSSQRSSPRRQRSRSRSRSRELSHRWRRSRSHSRSKSGERSHHRKSNRNHSRSKSRERSHHRKSNRSHSRSKSKDRHHRWRSESRSPHRSWMRSLSRSPSRSTSSDEKHSRGHRRHKKKKRKKKHGHSSPGSRRGHHKRKRRNHSPPDTENRDSAVEVQDAAMLVQDMAARDAENWDTAARDSDNQDKAMGAVEDRPSENQDKAMAAVQDRPSEDPDNQDKAMGPMVAVQDRPSEDPENQDTAMVAIQDRPSE